MTFSRYCAIIKPSRDGGNRNEKDRQDLHRDFPQRAQDLPTGLRGDTGHPRQAPQTAQTQGAGVGVTRKIWPFGPDFICAGRPVLISNYRPVFVFLLAGQSIEPTTGPFQRKINRPVHSLIYNGRAKLYVQLILITKALAKPRLSPACSR